MKKIGIVLFIYLLIPAIAIAGSVIADGSITVSSSPQGFSSIPDDAATALIIVEGGSIRVSFKTTPTAQSGFKLDPGVSMTIDSMRDIVAFRAILDSSASGATAYYSIESR